MSINRCLNKMGLCNPLIYKVTCRMFAIGVSPAKKAYPTYVDHFRGVSPGHKRPEGSGRTFSRRFQSFEPLDLGAELDTKNHEGLMVEELREDS